ncbi:hypothetical protein [Nocardioides currus]|uniref:WXG100 family type VII secretion target n=1 Tax=Nocardioides currus TaxID=2133958 RepID=A0A2R7YTQ9_9ACTN|nr:hypothetical protein [Nocardioides currus]PUA79768.1 hypothetical protein C7S10_16940 [Nocardioides currus]
MAEAREPTGGGGQLRVDLPELRGYATALDDVSRDLGGCEGLANSYCVDADFGKIVEELTSDYAALLPQMKELLAENETVMRQYAVATDRTVGDFERTDDGVASRFQGDGIDASRGSAFFALAPVGASAPYASEGDLPEVSFGFVFDNLCWALEKFCGWDVRGEVTDWIAGDVVGLSTQASCWEIVGDRLGTTRDNLRTADSRVLKTWEGLAANQHAAGMIVWDTALTDQSDSFKELGQSLKDLAKECVNVAQLVVDCIRLAVDLIASAWALQYIPVYGQVKFVKKCWDAYKRAQKAIAYLKMIVSALRFTKSLIVVMVDKLTPTMLPGEPIGV